MKFRVSIAGSENGALNGEGMGEIDTGAVSNVAMNFVSGDKSISSAVGGLGQGGGIILSSDEILEVSYSTSPIYGEVFSASQSQVILTIFGRLIPTASDNENLESSENGSIAGGIMSALGMGTLYNQYQSVKSMFDKNDVKEEVPKESLSSSLLSSSGITENEAIKPVNSKSGSHTKELISQALGVSSAIPMTASFANGIGNSLQGMFGNLKSFGEGDLYDQNKQNVIELSEWAMKFENENKSTKDVMVQTDLGGGKTFELYFPKMYVESFDQSFNVNSGEGYFSLVLKQTLFNEERNKLK